MSRSLYYVCAVCMSVLLLLGHAAAQSWEWAAALGGSLADDQVMMVETDGQGNTYAVGKFFGSLPVPGGTLTAAGASDYVLVKFDTAGSILWGVRMGSNSLDEEITGLAVDAVGNIAVCGHATGSISFGQTAGAPLSVGTAAERRLAVALYNTSGVLLWARADGDIGQAANTEYASWIKFDPQGQIRMMFQLQVSNSSAIHFPPLLPVTIPEGISTGGIVAFNATGQAISVWIMPEVSIDGESSAIDPQGNYYMYSLFDDSLFPTEYRLQKYSSAGALLWSRQMSASVNFAFGGQAVYISPKYGFPFEYDYIQYATSGQQDCFAARIDPDNGQLLWMRRIGGPEDQSNADIAADPAGNLYIAGNTTGNIQYGTAVYPAPDLKIMVAKFTPAGDLAWLQTAGSNESELVLDMALHAADQVVIGGRFFDSAAIGGHVITSSGFGDGFVARMGCNPAPIGGILGDTLVCAGPQAAGYQVGNPIAGMVYQWKQGGNILASLADSVQVQWQQAGIHPVTVQAFNACGAGTADTLWVRVRSAPSFSQMTGDTVPCLGQSVYSVADMPESQYSWSVSGGGTIFGFGNSAVVSWVQPGPHTVSVQASNSCGQGAPELQQVQVQQVPAQPSPISGSAQICLGAQMYSVSPVTGLTYQWSLSSGGTLTSNGAGVLIQWSQPGTHTLTVTPSSICGPGPSRSLSIQVTASPAQPSVIQGDAAPCIGQENYAVLAQPDVSYSWSLSGGGVIAPAGNSAAAVSWLASGMHTITVTPSNVCGAGPARVQSIQVNTVPGQPPLPAGLDTVCTGLQSYVLPPIASQSYQWSLSGGGVLLPAGNTSDVIWNMPGLHTLTVAPVNVCGIGSSRSMPVWVLPAAAPADSIAGDAAVCTGGQSYAVPSGPGGPYVWSLNGGGILTAFDSAALVQWTDPGLHLLSVFLANGCAIAKAVQVTGLPISTGVIQGDSAGCAGASSTYTVPYSPDIQWAWSSTGGSLVSQYHTAAVHWGGAGAYTLTAMPYNQCGAGNPLVYPVQIDAVPAGVPAWAASDTVCVGAQEEMALQVPAGMALHWVLSSGGILFPDSAGAEVWWEDAGVHTLGAAFSNACGTGLLAVRTTVVADTPAVEWLAYDTLACAGPAAYAVVPVPGVQYVWAVSPGAQLLSGTGDSTAVMWPQAGTYTLEVVPYNICGSGQALAHTVHVREKPASPEWVLLDSTVCTGQQFYQVAEQPEVSYQWQLSGGGGIAAGGSSASVVWVQPGTYVLQVQAVNDCGSSHVRSLPVSVGSVPAMPPVIQGAAAPCPGSQVYSVVPAAGVAYDWLVSGGGLVAASQQHQASVDWMHPGIHELNVSARNSCGSSTPRTMFVQVQDVPAPLPYIQGPVSGCAGEALDFRTASRLGIRYQWTDGAGQILAGEDSILTWNFSEDGPASICVSPVSHCGAGVPVCAQLEIYQPLPDSVQLTGPGEVCAGKYARYAVPALEGVQYRWVIDGEDAWMPGPEALLGWDIPGTHTLELVLRNPCGEQLVSERLIAVSSAPPAPVLTVQDGLLISSGQGRHVWYRDQVLVAETENHILPDALPGTYRAEAVNACGRSPMSGQVLIGGLPGAEYHVITYPNPVEADLHLEFPPYLGWIGVEVYNANGQHIARIDNLYREQHVLVDTRTWASGLYVLHLHTELGILVKKVMRK